MPKPIKGLDSQLAEAVIGTLHEPIIILDEKMNVLVASRAFYDVFGVEYEDVQGKSFYTLGNGEWDIPAFRTLLEKIIPDKTVVEKYEVQHTFKKLGKRVVMIDARQIKFDKHRRNILLSISDVTDEHKMQKDNKLLMEQKDTLLLEMRHRIANSLQLIASIIMLKAGTTKSKESKFHLEDAYDRIISIATVQRNLDPTGEDSLVQVVPYLTTLCESVAKSMIGGRRPITLKVAGSNGSVTPDEAIGLGLVTTELVINALKHAFPAGEGQITVSYEQHGPKWMLSIGDDGVGLSATHTASNEGLGTSILGSIAHQLNADIHRESSSRGTVVTLSHPPSHPRKAVIPDSKKRVQSPTD